MVTALLRPVQLVSAGGVLLTQSLNAAGAPIENLIASIRGAPRPARPKRPEAASPQSSHRGWINRAFTKLSLRFQKAGITLPARGGERSIAFVDRRLMYRSTLRRWVESDWVIRRGFSIVRCPLPRSDASISLSTMARTVSSRSAAHGMKLNQDRRLARRRPARCRAGGAGKSSPAMCRNSLRSVTSCFVGGGAGKSASGASRVNSAPSVAVAPSHP